MPDVLFQSNDLMFASRVGGAASRANVSVQTAASVNVGEYASAAEVPRMVILDLSTSGIDVAACVTAWRTLKHPPRIVAYAPHVHEAKLASARAAQCDAVLTKGQFDSQLDAIFASVSEGSES